MVFGFGTFFLQNHWICLRKCEGCGDFSEKSPRSKGHNFRATEPFLKSRHSRNIYSLQFVDFCRKFLFLPRLKYPAAHLPEAIFRKIPCTALLYAMFLVSEVPKSDIWDLGDGGASILLQPRVPSTRFFIHNKNKSNENI